MIHGPIHMVLCAHNYDIISRCDSCEQERTSVCTLCKHTKMHNVSLLVLQLCIGTLYRPSVWASLVYD